MSERDDLNEQVFHDPLGARAVITRSAAAAAQRIRDAGDALQVGQRVHYLYPPGGGSPIDGRVVEVKLDYCLVSLPQGEHWLRNDHLKAVGHE